MERPEHQGRRFKDEAETIKKKFTEAALSSKSSSFS